MFILPRHPNVPLIPSFFCHYFPSLQPRDAPADSACVAIRYEDPYLQSFHSREKSYAEPMKGLWITAHFGTPGHNPGLLTGVTPLRARVRALDITVNDYRDNDALCCQCKYRRGSVYHGVQGRPLTGVFSTAQ